MAVSTAPLNNIPMVGGLRRVFDSGRTRSLSWWLEQLRAIERFGGVEAIGMGAYHGQWGSETFRHPRSALAKRARPDLRVVYLPYSDRAQAILRMVF